MAHSSVTSPERRYWQQAHEDLDDDQKKSLATLTGRLEKDTEAALEKLSKSAERHPDSYSATRKLREELGKKKLNIDDMHNIVVLANKKTYDHMDVCDLAAKVGRQAAQYGNSAPESADLAFQLLAVAQRGHRISAQKKERFKLKIGQKEFQLGDAWKRLVDGVKKAEPVISVAVQSDPIAGTVWSILKLFLKVAVDDIEVAAQIVAGVDAAVGATRRGAAYEQVLQILEQHPEQEQLCPHLATFRQDLVQLYKRILTFLVDVVVLRYSGTRTRRVFHKVKSWWSAQEIAKFEEDISPLEHRLQEDLGLVTNTHLTKMAQELSIGLSKIQDQLQQMTTIHGEHQQNLKGLFAGLEYKTNKEERHHVLAWVSNRPYEDFHDDARRGHVRGTGDWIFGKPEYKSWLDSPRAFLWITGIPGAGKTCLVSRIVDHFLEEQGDSFGLDNVPGDIQVAYFYCKSDDDSRRSSESIFRNYIKQLSDQYEDLPSPVRALYEVKARKGSASTRWKSFDYIGVLNELVRRRRKTVFILDALDECRNDEAMKTVLSDFQKLLGGGEDDTSVKMIISSRFSSIERARRGSEGHYHLEITGKDNQGDIRDLIRDRIESTRETLGDQGEYKPKLQFNPSPPTRKRLTTLIAEKNHGMFLWASLYLDLFCDADTESDLQEELDKLEKSSGAAGEGRSDPTKVMKNAYDVFFARVLGQARIKRAERALRAFQWLTALGGSCEKPVLLAAVNQPLGGDKIVAADCDEALLLVCCQNLVVASDSVFRFCHLSAQEYWQGYGKGVEDSHFVVAKTCARVVFNYDNPDVFATLPDRLRKEQVDDDPKTRLDKLWDFACMYWRQELDLVVEGERKREIWDLVLRALRALRCGALTSIGAPVAISNWVLRLAASALESRAYHTPSPLLYEFLRSEKAWAPSKESFRVSAGHFSPTGHRAAVAAILGGFLLRFLHLFQKYLEDDGQWPRDLADSYCGFVLYLDNEVNTVDGFGGQNHDKTTTHPANNAQESHVLPSRSYLNPSPPPPPLEQCSTDEKYDRDDLDAGRERATRKFQEMVERVLETQRPHLPNRCYEEFARLVVLLVFSRKHKGSLDDDLLRQLLERYPESYTLVGFEELVPIGLQDYGSAINSAAYEEDSRILRCLLCELKSRHDLTLFRPLSEECGARESTSHDDTASENSSRTQPMDQYFGDALISVSSWPVLENVRMLIENGADPNFREKWEGYRTPLIAACVTGQLQVVRLLIESGADVRQVFSKGEFTSPLLATVENSHPAVVKLLLSKLKFSEMDRNDIVSCLEAAVHSVHPRIVYLLLPALGPAYSNKGKSYNMDEGDAAHRARIDEILRNARISGRGYESDDKDSKLLEQFAVDLIHIRQASLREDSDLGMGFINTLRHLRGKGRDPITNGRSVALSIGFNNVNNFMYLGFDTLINYTGADPTSLDPSGNAPHTMSWEHAADCWRRYIEGLEERDIDTINFEQFDSEQYDFGNSVGLKDWLRSGGLRALPIQVEMRRGSTFSSAEQLHFFQDDMDELDLDDGDDDYESGFSVDSEEA